MATPRSLPPTLPCEIYVEHTGDILFTLINLVLGAVYSTKKPEHIGGKLSRITSHMWF